MSIFDGARNKLKNTARAAIDSSRDMMAVSKLNTDIKAEEEKIKVLKLELGNSVYKAYIGENPSEEDLNAKCEEIKLYEGNILSLKEKIHKIKSQNMCPECGVKLDENYIFCPRCGLRLIEEGGSPEGAVDHP